MRPLAAIANINLDYVGYIIVALFVVSWLLAISIWRFGRIEERWSTNLSGQQRRITSPASGPHQSEVT